MYSKAVGGNKGMVCGMWYDFASLKILDCYARSPAGYGNWWTEQHLNFFVISAKYEDYPCTGRDGLRPTH